MSDAIENAVRRGAEAAIRDVYPLGPSQYLLGTIVEEIMKQLPTHVELGDIALEVLGREFTRRVKGELHTMSETLNRRTRKASLATLATVIPLWIAQLEQISAALCSFIELKDVEEALEFINMMPEQWAGVVLDNEGFQEPVRTPHVTIVLRNGKPHLLSNPDNVEVTVMGKNLDGYEFAAFVLELGGHDDD